MRISDWSSDVCSSDLEVENRAYAGGWWDWLTPFSLLTGVALVVGYSLLGATWLVLKTEGSLPQQARRYAWVAGIATLVLLGVVRLAPPFLTPRPEQRRVGERVR